MKVKEIFGPTIQGEGIHAGEICSFIRFAGCDQKPCCKWCDTLDAYNIESGEEMRPVDLSHSIPKEVKKVVLTGGNPCIQDKDEMYTLLYLLKQKSKVYLETQGTVFPKWIYELDHITISPKPPSAYDYKQFGQDITAIKEFVKDYYIRIIYNLLNERQVYKIPILEFKIVVFTKEDLEYAGMVFKEVNEGDILIPKSKNYDSDKVSDIISIINKSVNFTIQVGTDIHNKYSTKEEIIKYSRDMDLAIGYAFNISDNVKDTIDKVTIVGWSEGNKSEIHNINYTIYRNNIEDKTLFKIDIDKTHTIEGEVNFKYNLLQTNKIDNKDITIHYHIEYEHKEVTDNKRLTTNEIINWVVKVFPEELVSNIRILPQIHRMLEVK